MVGTWVQGETVSSWDLGGLRRTWLADSALRRGLVGLGDAAPKLERLGEVKAEAV